MGLKTEGWERERETEVRGKQRRKGGEGGTGDGGVELGAKHQPPTTEGEEGRKGGWINSKKGVKKKKKKKRAARKQRGVSVVLVQT